jgi:hypothetical protein
MTTLESVNARAAGHIHSSISTDETCCPYCGRPISRKEFKEIQTRIEDEERARISKMEQALKDKFARETAQAEAKKKAEIEKAQKEAAKVADTKMKLLIANQDAVIAARLKTQREAAEKKLAEAVSAERTKMFGEKLKLEEQLQDMQRRLQRKTAHELGEPAEVDLYEALAAALPDDRISRVAKGVKGPDVIVEVVHNGAVVGSIVLDSKNHARWLHAFTRKLRADQLAGGADFAILSSSVFPAGAQQLHIQDGVIVANPARVVMLVHLLRRQVIQNHVLKLGSEARNEKADKLYSFIISPACTDLLDRIVKLTEDMAALDFKEASVHETTWKKRADLIRGVQASHDEFSATMSRIIGTVVEEASL